MIYYKINSSLELDSLDWIQKKVFITHFQSTMIRDIYGRRYAI